MGTGTEHRTKRIEPCDMSQCFRSVALAAIALTVAHAHVLAQTTDGADTTQTYSLGEVVVTSDSIRTVSTTTVQRIPYTRIARADALTSAGVVYQIPAARIQ